MNENLNGLKQLLALHDWYFDYSDDHSVWTKGMAQRQAINTEQKRLISEGLATADEITELTDKYRPKGI